VAEPVGVTLAPGPVEDLAAWVPAVLAGQRVVLRNGPGAVALAREPFAAGLVCLVGDPADAASVDAAVARAEVEQAPQDVLDAAREVLARRLCGFRADGSPGTGLTAPGVLGLVLHPAEREAAVVACTQASSWGGLAQLVVLDRLRCETPSLDSVAVSEVGDPTRRLPDRLAGRALRGIGRLPATDRFVASAGRGLTLVQHYTSPARIARTAAWEPAAPIDLVVSSSELGQALVWETLRRRPGARSRGTLTRSTLRDLVRDITVQVASGRRPDASGRPAAG